MKLNAITVAVALVRELLPLIQEIIEDVQDAKDSQSDGGRVVTKKEKTKIVTDAVLAIIPKLHDILLKSI